MRVYKDDLCLLEGDPGLEPLYHMNWVWCWVPAVPAWGWGWRPSTSSAATQGVQEQPGLEETQSPGREREKGGRERRRERGRKGGREDAECLCPVLLSLSPCAALQGGGRREKQSPGSQVWCEGQSVEKPSRGEEMLSRLRLQHGGGAQGRRCGGAWEQDLQGAEQSEPGLGFSL